MNTERRSFLRDLMNLAWGFYRTDLRSSSPRTFADALAGAWRWVKGRAARAVSNAAFIRRHAGRTVALSSMLQSPIRRGLIGPYADVRAREAGYTTSKIGA